jgi:hypothetical protein
MFSFLIIITLLISNIVFISLYLTEVKKHKNTLKKYSPKLTTRQYDPFDVDYWGSC